MSSWKPSYEEPQDIPEEHVAEASHSAPLAEGSAESSNVPPEEAELVAPAQFNHTNSFYHAHLVKGLVWREKLSLC